MMTMTSSPSLLPPSSQAEYYIYINLKNCNSYLWNAMINPLKRIQLKGFLWYQGESNGGYNRDLYQCSFPTMIDSWREEFTAHAGVPPLAPFGFVQVL
jgi:sialate O-acetylesterase